MGEEEFYKVGGTIHSGAPSYVVRQADRDLYAALKGAEFSYVLDSRQLGKSSLMVHTAARLREEGVAVVILDLTAVGQTLNPDQWYAGLLNQASKELSQAGLELEDELDDFWLSRQEIGPMQRWVEALREVVLVRCPGQLVVFVDEIDAVRSLQFSADEFFAGIREIYNRRARDPELNRLTFCLLGVAVPSELIRDTRTTPFNIGRRIELEDFTETEAAPLGRGLNREEPLARQLLSRILYWTAGHPYLTQSLCRAVAEDPNVSRPSDVDQKCRQMFLSRGAREKNDNLLFVSNRMLSSEADTTAILDLYGKIRASDNDRFGRRLIRDQKDNRLVNHLRLAGITRVTDGYLRVRNRIYFHVFDREWISAKMPNDEKRRLAAAYRRGALRASAIAAVALIAGLAGTWIYLEGWVLERESYYKTFIKHWGIPKGIGQLAPWQVQRRNLSYKFVTRGRFGPLLRMQAVNGAGTLVPKNPVGTYLKAAEEDTREERECQWEFILDNSRRVVYEKAKDRFGRLVWVFVYSPREELVTDNLAHTTSSRSEKAEAYFVGPDGYPKPQRGSSAEYVEITYDKDGLEEQILYRDRNGKPMPGPDRAYGRRCVYEGGMLVDMVSLDAKCAPTVDTAGNCEEQMKYDDSSNMVEAEARDTKGHLTVVKSGWSILKQKFDAVGNLIELSFFDARGRAVRDKNGIARQTESYDAHGNLTEYANFDEKGRPVRSKYGFAHLTASYDERGNRTEEAYFDEAGKPVRIGNGIARAKMVYDARGNRTEEAYFDEAGKPVRIGNGIARVKMVYDARGNRIETTYFDEASKPLGRLTGPARSTEHYDDRGNKIEAAYFDEDGKPMRGNPGYARWKASYDEHDNETEEAYFDEAGKPMLSKAGYVRWTASYDERGNKIRRQYYNEDGKPTRSQDSYSLWTASYDTRGNLIDEAYFDERGSPVLSKFGYARRTASYDEHGAKTEEAYFDAVGKPVRKDGCALWRASYDDWGNMTEQTFFDEGGQPVQIEVGYARRTARYDERGNLLEVDYFDRTSKPLRRTLGYARKTASYDARDYRTEEAYFDEEGKPLRNKDGYARWTARYDERGNVIEMDYFDGDGNPRGRESGYARWTASYDSRNNKTEEAYFDEEGKPLRNKDGYARWTASYDERGYTTEQAFFDEEDKPAQILAGYARWTALYDERGNMIETDYFDGSAKPLRHEFGYARRTATYDSRNNKTEEAYFDEEGKPLRNNNGYARWTARYDEAGRMVGKELSDLDGKNGYSIERQILDDKGNLIEVAYFDSAGRPTLDNGGISVVRRKYDENGKFAETSFFDTEGRPLRAHVEIQEVVSGGPGERCGLRAGDILLSYDGREVPDMERFIASVRSPGESPRPLRILRDGSEQTLEVPPGLLNIVVRNRAERNAISTAIPEETH